jgi:hypothetical protein
MTTPWRAQKSSALLRSSHVRGEIYDHLGQKDLAAKDAAEFQRLDPGGNSGLIGDDH